MNLKEVKAVSKIKLLLDVVSDMRSLADSLQAVCDAMAESEPIDEDKKPTPVKEAEPKKTAKSNVKAVKLEEVRAVLAEKSQAGMTAITLSYKGRKQRFYIHRLVADCFLPPPKTGEYEVNHKDLDKQNNHDSNLEWSTREKNFEHAYSNGKVDFRRPIRCDNKTGKQGVSKQTGGYQVSISYNRCRRYLGWFKDLDTAVNVRNKAEKGLIENEVY